MNAIDEWMETIVKAWIFRIETIDIRFKWCVYNQFYYLIFNVPSLV